MGHAVLGKTVVADRLFQPFARLVDYCSHPRGNAHPSTPVLRTNERSSLQRIHDRIIKKNTLACPIQKAFYKKSFAAVSVRYCHAQRYWIDIILCAGGTNLTETSCLPRTMASIYCCVDVVVPTGTTSRSKSCWYSGGSMVNTTPAPPPKACELQQSWYQGPIHFNA